MSTRLYFRNTRINSAIHANACDLTDWTDTISGVSNGVTTTTASGTEILLKTAASIVDGEWISDQIDQPITISGAIALKLWALDSTGASNATLRAKVWKLSAGGSDLLTFIGTFDGTTEVGTNFTTFVSPSGTPSPSVVMSQRERFVIKIYAIPAPSLTMGASTVTFGYDNAVAQTTGFSYIDFTETFNLLGDGTKLYLRDSTVNGIGGFRDLLAGKGASTVTGVVNTTASGSDIQWTKTAGGAALEWISPRILNPVASFTTPSTRPYMEPFAFESATAANCQLRCRVWKRDLAGTETLIWGPYNAEIEMTTSAAVQAIQNGQSGIGAMTTSFAEDDRIVLRLYIHNFGTMGGSRTCTVNYGGATGNGVSLLTIGTNLIAFKAESEPNGSPARIPNGGMMMGIDN